MRLALKGRQRQTDRRRAGRGGGGGGNEAMVLGLPFGESRGGGLEPSNFEVVLAVNLQGRPGCNGPTVWHQGKAMLHTVQGGMAECVLPSDGPLGPQALGAPTAPPPKWHKLIGYGPRRLYGIVHIMCTV